MSVLSLSRWVLVVLLYVTGIRTDKEPTGPNPLPVLEPSAVILNFGFGCQYLIFDVQHLTFSHDCWSVSIPHSCSTRQQHVVARDVHVRMNGDGGNVQLDAGRGRSFSD